MPLDGGRPLHQNRTFAIDFAIVASIGLAPRAMLTACALADGAMKGGVAFNVAGRRWREVSNLLFGSRSYPLLSSDRRRFGRRP